MNFSLDIVDTFTSLPKAEIYHHKVLGRAKKHWHAGDTLACVSSSVGRKKRAHTHIYILNSYYFRYVFKYVYIFNFKSYDVQEYEKNFLDSMLQIH